MLILSKMNILGKGYSTNLVDTFVCFSKEESYFSCSCHKNTFFTITVNSSNTKQMISVNIDFCLLDVPIRDTFSALVRKFKNVTYSHALFFRFYSHCTLCVKEK